MKAFRGIFRLWLFISFGMLTFLMATRIWALIYYGHTLTLKPISNGLLKAFWMGFRFDLSAVCYLGAIPALLLFIFWPMLWWPKKSNLVINLLLKSLQLWFGLMIPIYAFITIVDFLFYDYFQDHLNTMIFGFLNDDTTALIKTMWKDYNSLPYLIVFFFLAATWWRFLKSKFTHIAAELRAESQLTNVQKSWRPQLILGSLFLAIFLGARGSLSLFPLNVADASVSKSPFVNYLAFSGIHAFVRAVQLQNSMETKWNINADYYGYYSFPQIGKDLRGIPEADFPKDPLEILRKRTGKNLWAEQTKPHVVVIMMESFGSSWLKYHRDEFNLYGALEKHFHDDVLIENFFPSMTATIGSLSAFMVNTPHRPLGEFLTEGRYFNVPFRTAPARVYKKAGYKTRFLYGGAIGWRNVDRFARLQGFDSIEGDFEIEKFETEKLGMPSEKHDWGNHDEAVFRYLEDSLLTATEPQFVLVMTTTNHPPFDVPKTYKPFSLILPTDLLKILIVDADTAIKRFRAFQYSNQVLGELLDRIKSSSLGQNTLLAVTGDHGFLLKNFEQDELMQKWQVPFYLYLPEEAKKAQPLPSDLRKKFGSHPDIMPTLFELSLSETEHFSMGENLWKTDPTHPAFHYSHLAMNSFGAVLALPKEQMTALNWKIAAKNQTNPYLTLTLTEPTEQHRSLATQYKSTMAFLDFFYEYEREFFYAHPSR